MRSAQYSLPGPHLIKLDTHGYEVPILCGATETLRNTNLLVIETYNFRLIEAACFFMKSSPTCANADLAL